MSVNDRKLIYSDLTYKLIGLFYKIFNTLGYGYREQYYERALEQELQKLGIPYERQRVIPLTYDGKIIGKYVIDFVIDRKVIVELKVTNIFRIKDFQQILSYLKANSLKLGILVLITKRGIRYRRVLNIQ